MSSHLVKKSVKLHLVIAAVVYSKVITSINYL